MTKLNVTIDELDELLKDYPAELKMMRALPDLQAKLDNMEQPPNMGILCAIAEKKRCMLIDLWATHFPGQRPPAKWQNPNS